MSADLLRRAAGQIREDWDNPDDARAFPKAAAYNLGVAHWLDAAANTYEPEPNADEYTEFIDACNVARAYLGEQS